MECYEAMIDAALPAPLRSAVTRALRDESVDALALLSAAVNHDGARAESLARPLGDAAAALIALMDIAATPLLQAARKAHARDALPAWGHGPCPLCGALAAMAELRGLERRRRLRCGQCGADGEAPAIGCAHCGATDHQKLVVLLPEGGGESRRVDACDSCGGYMKTLTTAMAWPGESVRIEDLSSVDLDIAAIDRGRRRPSPPMLSPAASVLAAREPRLWGLLS